MPVNQAPIQYPLVNGVRHSFASIELKVGTDIYNGFRAIDYNRVRTRAKPRGNHPDPYGKTIGENDYTATIEFYLAEFYRLINSLGNGYGDIPVEVSVTYAVPAIGGSPAFVTHQDIIKGGTIDSSEASQQTGPDALTRKIDLNPTKILYDGLEDLLVPLSGATNT